MEHLGVLNAARRTKGRDRQRPAEPGPSIASTPEEDWAAPTTGWSATLRLGSIPANSEQDLRFLQDRLALFGKTTFFISAMFLFATSGVDHLAEVPRYAPLGRISHLVGTVIALALWRIARRRRALSPRALQALDVVCTLGICWSFAGLAHHAVQPYGGYIGLLSVTHVSIARAMIVPSMPRRSLLVAATSFAALVVSRAVMPLPPEMELVGGRSRGVVEALLWSTAGTVVAVVASVVIYGLREKVREARRLGQYELEEKLGEGGMGEVYRARHAMLRRPTAVKLLTGDGSERQLRRFENEVRLTARLTHPNTISIYDYGRTPDGVFYYAMELLEGVSLEQLVDIDGPQPPGRVIHILQQVCGALAEAHGTGLIHRDIKPANIHLSRRGDIPDFVKVLDFGLVREITSDGTVTQSSVDVVVGTPLYMAPEAILTPGRVDARADIYGMGCVAYALLTGTAPFSGSSVVEVCAHHLHTPPTPPSERQPVPDDLDALVLSCLEKDPRTRPQSARVLLAELRSCRDAGSWSEADAESWWTRSAVDAARAAAGRTVSTERTCQTFCPADLDLRTSRSGSRR